MILISTFSKTIINHATMIIHQHCYTRECMKEMISVVENPEPILATSRCPPSLKKTVAIIVYQSSLSSSRHHDHHDHQDHHDRHDGHDHHHHIIIVILTASRCTPWLKKLYYQRFTVIIIVVVGFGIGNGNIIPSSISDRAGVSREQSLDVLLVVGSGILTTSNKNCTHLQLPSSSSSSPSWPPS